MSTMMFPSADDPLNYPSQPLTTFESNQQYSKNNPYMNQGFNGVEQTSPMLANPTRGGREDNLEAQFFALPPYIEQRQQPQRPGVNFANVDFGGHSNAMGTPTTQVTNGWPTQQQGMPQGNMSGIDIGQLFGGNEWLPQMMNPSGYQ